MYEWQVKSYPTCNNLHELSWTTLRLHDYKPRNNHSNSTKNNDEKSKSRPNLEYVASGYFRSVFKLKDNDGTTKRVLKTLKYSTQKFNKRNMIRHQKDATIAGLLGGSKHIVDIYGYCGNSGLYEYGMQGTLSESFRYSKTPPSDMNKLRAAVQVSEALRDLHALGGGTHVAVSHTDILYNQFINIGGEFKLNDFNRAHFHYWNSTTGDVDAEGGETCPYIYPSPNEATVSIILVCTDVSLMCRLRYADVFLLYRTESFTVSCTRGIH
jgi:hypothetical protein